MSSANQRSYDYKNTLQIARSKHKKIVYLEKRNHISPLRLVGFASLGYGVTLFLWIARFFSKDNVDKGLREALICLSVVRHICKHPKSPLKQSRHH
jgi:hypothetical protein